MTRNQNMHWGPNPADFKRMLESGSVGKESKEQVSLVWDIVKWMMEHVYKKQIEDLMSNLRQELDKEEDVGGTPTMRGLMNAASTPLDDRPEKDD